MYGLPKIHKEGVPLRPILAAYQTPSYKIAKFLIPLLEEYAKSIYTTKNSHEFQEHIANINLPSQSYMVSNDVVSLFKNIPLEETITMICNKIFANQQFFHGMSKLDFRTLLSLLCKETFFIFNDQLYAQHEGCSMGSPNAPISANIFLAFKESQWLQECPHEYKPLHYKRYVDDTFVIFNNSEQSQQFLDYLKRQHPNTKFTCETQQDSALSFLDMNVKSVGSRLSTSIL